MRYYTRFGDPRVGVNFDAEEYASLRQQGRLAICNASGKVFDCWNVEVTARYADCSVFKCPACKGSHDDRQAWNGDRNARMGYRLVAS